MKVFRNISFLAFVFSVISCSMAELHTDDSNTKRTAIQVVPRVMPLGQWNVDTKATFEPTDDAEQYVSGMAMAIFDNAGECIEFQYYPTSSPKFTIIREDLENVTTNGLTQSSIYVFANVPAMAELAEDDWTGKKVEWFRAIEADVAGVGIPAAGFPMIGVYDSNPADNLGPTIDLTPRKPLATPLLNVEMYASYAKIVVNIGVNSELDEWGLDSKFKPSRWEVFNVASKVDTDSTDVESTPSVLANSFPSYVFKGAIQAVGNEKVSFSFYLPERLLNPANKDYVYPFVTESGGVLRPEDERFRQKYKPHLVEPEQKATYVRVSGIFSDHQGHDKNVSYDIYLGQNNFDDFNIRGNYQYNNNVTIKSAKNYNDIDIETQVSYDARVNISEEDFTVRVERETLLDAHWEVRPLRVNVLNGSVKVIIKDAANKPWIRMESTAQAVAANNTATHLLGNNVGNAYGKRRYFTVDLHDNPATVAENDGILAGNTEYDLNQGDHCIWIYVDENVATTNETVGGKSIPKGADAIREAVISITHYEGADCSGAAKDPLDYKIAQRQLYPVRYTSASPARDTIYNIEYHEEYLYNYDSTDGYGQTEYEGMPWGLDGDQLSNKYAAFYTQSSGESWWNSLVNLLVGWLGDEEAYKYDFYLERDNPHQNATVRGNSKGHSFTSEIIDYVNNDAKSTNDITTLALNEDPASAVEYCYNKNKRDSNGNVVELNWYLPAIDEMEEIAWAGYGEFDEFHDLYYWSSMPAFMRANITNDGSDYGDVYLDDTDRARATKVNYENGVPSSPLQSGLTAGKYSGYVPFTIKWTFILPTGIEVGEYVDTGEDSSFYEPGNHPRSKSNRVRCVYKP